MADAANFRQRNRLSPDVTRILYVRNLPFKLSSDELYDIFGKYGPIRQVRLDDERERGEGREGAWERGRAGGRDVMWCHACQCPAVLYVVAAAV